MRSKWKNSDLAVVFKFFVFLGAITGVLMFGVVSFHSPAKNLVDFTDKIKGNTPSRLKSLVVKAGVSELIFYKDDTICVDSSILDNLDSGLPDCSLGFADRGRKMATLAKSARELYFTFDDEGEVTSFYVSKSTLPVNPRRIKDFLRIATEALEDVESYTTGSHGLDVSF
jgi:hypothetical protein